MTRAQRLATNLFGSWFQMRRRFTDALLDEMAAAITAGERTHLGEVCFAVESRLSPLSVLDSIDARARATEVFAQLRVWDTQHNSGVLFYVLMAEHCIEIVADRGISALVAPDEWRAISQRVGDCYAKGQWREGSLEAIAAAHALLTKHFPGNGAANPDELPDRPVLL